MGVDPAPFFAWNMSHGSPSSCPSPSLKVAPIVCGAGAYSFAFALAAARGGQVLWVRETWEVARINPDGFAAFMDPADLLLCNAQSQIEALAVTEEALRSGAVALVIVSLTKPLGLTEGRRLQLAAKEGKSIALALIPEGMGSNAAETRWRCTPHFDADECANDRAGDRLAAVGAYQEQIGNIGCLVCSMG